MNSTAMGMISYAFLLAAAGVLAYLHLLPNDLLVATFYLVAGHAGANLPYLNAPAEPTTASSSPVTPPAAQQHTTPPAGVL